MDYESFFPTDVTPLEGFPKPEQWDDWQEWDPKQWPKRVARKYTLVPTICFNCEAACGLVAYVDKESGRVKKLEGNPYHPGSRGRNCAKGPATLNQIEDPNRILYPMKRVGERGSGKWERTTWDEVLDTFAAKIRACLVEDRRTEVMYHVGRPGEDGYVNRVLQSWGVDAHNSHTNVCSASARVGYALWAGADRPSPDHANAKFILLLSAHLETGHYFNPHAQRIVEGKQAGAKLCVVDVRLSNTASRADWWLAPFPGTEAVLLLALAHEILKHDLYDREFVEKWVNWRETLEWMQVTGSADFSRRRSDSKLESGAEGLVDANGSPTEVGGPGGAAPAQDRGLAPTEVGDPGGAAPAQDRGLAPTEVGGPGGAAPAQDRGLAPTEVGGPSGAATTEAEAGFDSFLEALKNWYAWATPEFAEAKTGVPAAQIREIAQEIGKAGSAFATHIWRNAAAGNLGGWQIARCLELLVVLMGAVGAEGGTNLHADNKFVPPAFLMPPPGPVWNELLYPREYPLAYHELSYLLPHFLEDGRGKVSAYFTRVYNPVWTNPDGFMWEKVLRDESKIELHAALTPVWNETAQYADYVLPMGNGAERYDLMSQETHAAKWIGFRQPVLRVARERAGESFEFTYEANPGEVWEESEFWIELSWRIDPDGSLGIRRFYESPYRPGEKIQIQEYYRWIFENSVPGLPERAARLGMTPYEYMSWFGAFQVEEKAFHTYPSESAERAFKTPSGKLEMFSQTMVDWGWGEHAMPGYFPSHVSSDPGTADFSRRTLSENEVEKATPGTADFSRRTLSENEVEKATTGTADFSRRGNDAVLSSDSGHSSVEVSNAPPTEVGGPGGAAPAHAGGLAPTEVGGPGGVLETTLIPTFRLPTLIHTRSANAKWLYELSNLNPVWIHPVDAEVIDVQTGDYVRVSTRIGYYVNRAWVTEGIRPGIIACSHHLGRWRLHDQAGTDRQAGPRVEREEVSPGVFRIRRFEPIGPYASADPDTKRIWWTDGGVHQNLTFPVQPDPVSGQHCWHQSVTIEKARPDDRLGDVVVDTNKSMEVYREWLAKTRPAPGPGGLRRPLWMDRVVRPAEETYYLPAESS